MEDHYRLVRSSLKTIRISASGQYPCLAIDGTLRLAEPLERLERESDADADSSSIACRRSFREIDVEQRNSLR